MRFGFTFSLPLGFEGVGLAADAADTAGSGGSLSISSAALGAARKLDDRGTAAGGGGSRGRAASAASFALVMVLRLAWLAAHRNANAPASTATAANPRPTSFVRRSRSAMSSPWPADASGARSSTVGARLDGPSVRVGFGMQPET